MRNGFLTRRLLTRVVQSGSKQKNSKTKHGRGYDWDGLIRKSLTTACTRTMGRVKLTKGQDYNGMYYDTADTARLALAVVVADELFGRPAPAQKLPTGAV